MKALDKNTYWWAVMPKLRKASELELLHIMCTSFTEFLKRLADAKLPIEPEMLEKLKVVMTWIKEVPTNKAINFAFELSSSNEPNRKDEKSVASP